MSIGGLGTPAQVGTFIVVLLACIRLVIPWRKQNLDREDSQIKQYAETCTALRNEVKELTEKLIACEDNCDKHVRELHDEIYGIRQQNIQEQISLINVIISSVDAPELQKLLRTMESVQAALRVNVIHSQVGNVLQPKKNKAGDDNA